MLFKKIDNIVFDNVDYNDYPNFCDAFIVSANWAGLEMNEEELEKLNEDKEFVYEKLMVSPKLLRKNELNNRLQKPKIG